MPTGVYIRTNKYREKMRIKRLGYKLSIETKNKIGLSNKGKKRTDDAKLKMSIKKKGVNRDKEIMNKLHFSNIGKKRTEEFSKRVSKIHKGKIVSLETRNKISKKLKGHKKSKEQCLKQSIMLRKAFLEGTRKINPPKHQHINYMGADLWNKSELKVATWLQENGYKWEHESQQCRFLLPNGRTYIIDFYLPELNIYIEVKGWWKSYSKYKVLEAQKAGLDLRIIDKRNIKCINLNLKDVPE